VTADRYLVKVSFEDNENVLKSIVVIAAQLYEYAKNY
jgi:hypothetical protein